MANEQTSVPLYAASEVLTAANMNISAGTGVPVFATTVTRDAAFGGASEKVLAEGQLCYLSSTNVVQYYDGAAWATVGPSTGAALVCVKAETAFSAVSSVTADNVFSTTYTNYLVVVRASGSTDEGLYIQMRVGGVTTTSNYNYQSDEVVGGANGPSRSASQSLMRLGTVSTSNSLATSNVYSPFVATQTSFINDNNVNSTYTTPRYIIVRGNQSGATSFDGLIITAGLATITGTLTVYGYSKAV